jgi:hypothetical protein
MIVSAQTPNLSSICCVVNPQKGWGLVGVDAYSQLLLTVTVVRALDTRTVCEHLEELVAECISGLPRIIRRRMGRPKRR